MFVEEQDNEEESKDTDSDIIEPLDDKETELRSYLLQGEALSEETLDEYTQKFWNEEPYK